MCLVRSEELQRWRQSPSGSQLDASECEQDDLNAEENAADSEDEGLLLRDEGIDFSRTVRYSWRDRLQCARGVLVGLGTTTVGQYTD